MRDGLITAVGDEGDVRDWLGPGTQVVRLDGAHLVPGLVDAHGHPVWGLEIATGTDLSKVPELRPALRGGLRPGRAAHRPPLKAWRGIATRFEKTPESYLAGLHLRASLIWIKDLTRTAH